MSSKKKAGAPRSAREKAKSILTGAGRNEWIRKPQTQVIKNRKAEQRRTWCRKGIDDGAVSFYPVCG
ncbi:hypothetical protein PCCS19_57910 [Paenibacillus sp. CCS19]|uniref:hypothetical protein n=1 Tax=Paenibacillus sp. CCS19 TaxID=3158387 RepID=UPI00256E964C|nr:hypothetical protein [Paenibacillus cellulosilyticus]GMK42731.1 hypothetical protein PCCS19_57910 [Paenibacillus cellulosilyticus]